MSAADVPPEDENSILGYPFAVGENPFCCWEWDLEQRNLEFLASLDTGYYLAFARALGADLDGEDTMSASIALRGAYHQGIETLFSFIGALVQAPRAVPAWLAHCRTGDLEFVVQRLRDGIPLLTEGGRRAVTLDAVADHVFSFTQWHSDDAEESTASRFADTWHRLAADLLDPLARAEYNSIKHGLRVGPGGFTMALGVEDQPGVRAPAERMRSLGGSVFGSTFFRSERVGQTAHNIRMRRVSLNWSAEEMVQRLELISMSIANVVGSLQCALGVAPETVRFVRPDRSEIFGDAWQRAFAISMSSIDSIVTIDPQHEIRKDELLDDLNGRGRAEHDGG